MTSRYVDFGFDSHTMLGELGPTRCSALDLELVRLVCGLPDQARAKLLAFLHLSRDSRALQTDLAVRETGEVHLSLASTPGGDDA